MSRPHRSRLHTLRSRYLLPLVLVAGLTWFWPAASPPPLRAQAAAGADPVIAAAGDIACDPTNPNYRSGAGTLTACRQQATSDLLVNGNFAAVLDLGDNQYYCGGYQAFMQVYDPTWGRVKSITHPVPGNHEYMTSGGTGCDQTNEGGAGYYTYFGAAAGSPSQGYYSFDVGAWHIIALNSSCADVGGCKSGSPQYAWLQADLESHPSFCTLAYWHIPRFSSGGRASGLSAPLWQLLYDHDADVILNGHDHIYERFAPQDPSGEADALRGIREFVVGTGGADHTTIRDVAANSEVRNADSFGVLALTLHATGYDWQFLPESGSTFADSGSGQCHGQDSVPPSAPASLAASPVAWNEVDLSWTAATDNVGVAGYRVFRNGTQIATVNSTSYKDRGRDGSTTYSYYVTAFDAAGLSSSPSNTASATTPPQQTSTPTATITPTVTPTPAAPPAVVFQDGFEAGDLSRWSSATGLAVESRQTAAGHYAAEAAVTRGPAAFATESLSLPLSDIYYRIEFMLNQRGANAVNLIEFQTAAGRPLVTLRINAAGRLALRNDVSGYVFSGGIPVTRGVWHTLQAHLVVAGRTSRSEVWYDGAGVPLLSRALHLTIDPVGRLQLGDARKGLTYDVLFDSVVASHVYIPDPLASAAPPVSAASYALVPAGSPVQPLSPYRSAIASPLPLSWLRPTP